MIPLICASLTNVLGLLTFIGRISGVPLLASVRAKYSDGVEHRLLLFPDWSWTDCASAESGVTVDSALTAKQFEVEDAFGTLFTEEQLHTTVTRYAGLPAQEFFDRVIGDVRQFSERKSFDDDVCVVGMEVQHTG